MGANWLICKLDEVIEGSTSFKDFFQKYLEGDGKEPFHINMHGNNGWTPLLRACRHEKIDIAHAFLLMGAKANSYNVNGLTPLFVAVEKGNLKLVQLLLKFGASPCKCTSDPISIAAEKGFEDIAFELIRSGSNPCEHTLLYENRHSSTILSASEIARNNGHIDLADKLALAESDFLNNNPSPKTYTPFQERQASMELKSFQEIMCEGNAEKLERLIEDGFILDVGLLRCLYNEPLWIYLMKNGYVEMAKLFCKHNVDMSDEFEMMMEKKFCENNKITSSNLNVKSIADIMNENYDNQIKALKQYRDRLPEAIQRSFCMFWVRQQNPSGYFTDMPNEIFHLILDSAHEDVPDWKKIVEQRTMNKQH